MSLMKKKFIKLSGRPLDRKKYNRAKNKEGLISSLDLPTTSPPWPKNRQTNFMMSMAPKGCPRSTKKWRNSKIWRSLKGITKTKRWRAMIIKAGENSPMAKSMSTKWRKPWSKGCPNIGKKSRTWGMRNSKPYSNNSKKISSPSITSIPWIQICMTKFQGREEGQGKVIFRMNRTKIQIISLTIRKTIMTRLQSQWKKISPPIIPSTKLQTTVKTISRLLIACNAKKRQPRMNNPSARSR